MTRVAPVLLLAAGQFLAMADRNLFAVAAPDAARALGLGDGALGFALGTAFALGYGLACVPFGRWADGRARRGLIVGGMALWTLGSLATGLARGPAGLIAARAALGVGQAAFAPAAVAALAEGDAATRSWRLAAFTGGSTLGRSAALLAGGAILVLLAPAGWRWLFAIAALPNILVAALLWPALGGAPLAAAAPRPRWRGSGALALFLVAAVAPLVIGQAATAWLPSLVVRRLGLPPGSAGMRVGLVVLVAAPGGQLLGGWLGRRWSVMRERPAAVIALALWAALPAFAALTVVTAPAAAAAAIAWANLAVGVATFAALFGWQELTPPGVRGTANGVFMAVTLLVGAGVGPLVTGVLSQHGAGLGPALAATALGTALLATAAAAARRA